MKLALLKLFAAAAFVAPAARAQVGRRQLRCQTH
jgi:hypothetical protein